MERMNDYPPPLPRNFLRWDGPWVLGDAYETDGHHDEAGEWVSHPGWVVRVWTRHYTTQSHCDTPGCCEGWGSLFGPEFSRTVYSPDRVLSQGGRG